LQKIAASVALEGRKMAEELRAEGKVDEGVVLLTIRYSPEVLIKTGAHERFSRELMKCYQTIRGKERERVKTNSCIVEIQSDVAGSPMVRALFDLWREIAGKESGQLVCVGYPQDYLDSLTALGLTTLPGFSLAGTRVQAVQKLRGCPETIV
jgi:hypothetical protein